MSEILVTGGAGYLGGFVVRELIQRGVSPLVVDNLSSGHRQAVPEGVPLCVADIKDIPAPLFRDHSIEAVIHLAASAHVGESHRDPAKYYANNVSNTIALLAAMRAHDVRKIVFASSCAVYGHIGHGFAQEGDPESPCSTYGNTKAVCENLLTEYARAYGLCPIALRFFNLAGAAFDGSLGEWPSPSPRIIPAALAVATGERGVLPLYGRAERDYVHVEDAAVATVAALSLEHPSTINVCTGTGYGVRDIVRVCAEVTDRPIPTEEHPARPYDPPRCVGQNRAAKNLLDWRPVHTLADIAESTWQWIRRHSELP